MILLLVMKKRRRSSLEYVKKKVKPFLQLRVAGGKIAAVLTSIPGASEYFKEVSFRMRRLK
jgi:hypothetical protein